MMTNETNRSTSVYDYGNVILIRELLMKCRKMITDDFCNHCNVTVMFREVSQHASLNAVRLVQDFLRIGKYLELALLKEMM